MGFVASYVHCVAKVWPLVILFWLGLLGFGCWKGPNLLLHTDNEVHETAGTLSAEANAIMSSNFDFSLHTPWIIVAECTERASEGGQGCFGDEKSLVADDNMHNLFNKITELLYEHHGPVFNKEKTNSWFNFNGTLFDTLKSNFISQDGKITYLQLSAQRNVTQSVRFQAYHYLQHELPRLHKEFCPKCHFLDVTGGDPLTDDVSHGLAVMLLRTNAVIMPFAMLLLVYMVGNWRLLLITAFNLAVVLLGSFAISDVISDAWLRPQSITPQMIEAIATAVTIDYSLFMFTRFIQELEIKRKRWNIRRHHYFQTVQSDTTSKNDHYVMPLQRPTYGQEYFGLIFDRSLDSEHDPHPGLTNPGRELLLSSLISTVEHSGHVVLVSGLTLILSFGGFIMTRCSFLMQPAFFTALGVAIAILTALSTTVAFISAFPSFFTDFNLFPAWMYKCCCPNRRKTMMFDTDFTGDEIYIEDPDELSYLASYQAATQYSTAPNRFQSHQSFAYENDKLQTFPGAVNDQITDRSKLMNNRGNVTNGGYGTSDGGLLESSPSQVVAFRGQTKDVSTVIDIPKFHSSFSYKFGRFLVKIPWNFIILFVVFGIMAFLASYIRDLELSSAYALGIPSNSPSLAALHKMEEAFAPGIIQPFYLLMRWVPKDPKEPPSSVNQEMFKRGAEYLKTFAEATGIDPKHTRSPFYWDGAYVDNSEDLPWDPSYTALFLQTVHANETQVTYLMTLLSPISPDSPDIVKLIDTMRTNVTHVMDDKYQNDEAYPTKFYLSGYKVTEQDTIDAAEKTFPAMLGVTFAVVIIVVAILLKSAFVPVRLILTLALPLAATFGLQILVYQHGILKWTGLECFDPGLRVIYWEIPVFSAVVLLSLALDFDIFIISRIAEHRENGYTNSSSILMGLHQTSSIITAAGVIMALTFSGLMFLRSTATAQLGFALVSSVLIDCFITRSILVPAILSWADGIGWWPRKVQFTGLKHYDGTVVN